MLSFIEEKIERSLYVHLLNRSVLEGYSPDIRNEVLYPDTPAGYTAYLAALEQVATDKGFAVEIFGSANPTARNDKKLPRISFQTGPFVPGDVGVSTKPQLEYDQENDKFDSYIYEGLTSNLFMDCTISAKTQAQYRILAALVNHSIPRLNYLPYWDDPSQFFLVELTGFLDDTSSSDGVLEGTFRFEIPDLTWVEKIKTDEVTAVMRNITVNQEINGSLGLSFTVN